MQYSKIDLSEINDEELCKNIQNEIHTNDSLKELINRHSGIYYKIVNKYVPSRSNLEFQSNLDKDLLFDSKSLVIFESAKKFNPDRGTKFSTYLGNETKFFCLNEINKDKRLVRFDKNDFENIFVEDEQVESYLDPEDMITDQIIDMIKNMPDKRVYEIVKLRYLNSEGKRPTPWSKIHFKISHRKNKNKKLTIQACIDLEKKAFNEISRKLKEKKRLESYRGIT